MPDKIILETSAFARGRVLVNEQLKRVRVGEEAWRDAKPGATLESALAWLRENGYAFDRLVRPRRTGCTITVRRFYKRAEAH